MPLRRTQRDLAVLSRVGAVVMPGVPAQDLVVTSAEMAPDCGGYAVRSTVTVAGTVTLTPSSFVDPVAVHGVIDVALSDPGSPDPLGTAHIVF